MKNFRATNKLLLVIFTTLFSYLLLIPGILWEKVGFNGKPWTGYFLSKWGGWVCAILGMKIKVEGKAPNPPFFIVSNHLSYLDVLLLISEMPCIFIAKSEVNRWPVFGFMARTLGMLFIKRERKTDIKHVNKLISQRINKDQGIILFPEGTTSAGENILPFKASLLAYPFYEKVPVSYCAIRYETPKHETPASESVAWHNDISFGEHIFELAKMKLFYGRIRFGEERILADERKELANILHDKVSTIFEPMTSNNLIESKLDTN